jgi:nucleotide-binding universal stress UspA family protein
MFSTIVVGTDGSDTAAKAVATAVDLAGRAGATVHLVSAYREPRASVAVATAGASAAADPAATEAALKSASEEILKRAAATAGDVPVEIHAVAGAPADVLLDVAEGVGADLIVVGSKGMKGARRLIGSVPNSVAHRAPVHVLVVKTT